MPTYSTRLLLSLGIVIGFGTVGTKSFWVDAVPVSGNAISADSIPAPTAVTVSQTCVTYPTPVRRPGAGGTSTATTGGGTLTLPVPSGVVAGDVLVAGVAAHGDYRTTPPTAPAGWTLVARTATGGLGQISYTHVATGNEPATYSWTGLSGNAVGGMAAYSGVDTATPVNAVAGDTSPTAPSLTTTRGNTVLIGFFSAASPTAATAPPSMTSIWSAATSNGGAAQQASSTVAEESWPNPGATGTRTASTSGSNQVSQMVALQPPIRPFATVTWTPSTRTYVTGQRYTRTSDAVQQMQTTLASTATSQYDGPLTSGTSYTVAVEATFLSWLSPPGTATFTGRAC